jgi:ligand-binding sensor domain-containing protein/two-component sensor histidine kinase
MLSSKAPMTRNLYRTILVVLLLLVANGQGKAEQLPLKAYTTADGLPHNVINKIVRDSRGFLWFCTDDGLSRFDGYEFINFGIEQGLPNPVVNDLLETREGEYWVATNGGLCKFNPNGVPSRQVVSADKLPANSSSGPMFIVVTPVTYDRYAKAVTTLLQVRDGTIWYGTRNGVFRLAVANTEVKPQSVDVGLEKDYPEQSDVNTLLEDRYGILWIGGAAGLYRRWPDGRSARYGKENGFPDDNIHDLLEDRNGNMWVATRFGGLLQLATSAGHEAPVVKHAYGAKNGLGTNWVFDLFESSEGKLWVGTNAGLCEFSLNDEKASAPLHVYTKRNGFSYHEIANLAEDRDGNLWLGTVNGAMKLARGGFSTFDERDGIGGINSIFASGTGGFYLSGYVFGDQRASVFEGGKLEVLNPSTTPWRRVGSFDGQRFTWLIPDALRNKHPGWSNKLVLQSRLGEWWIGSSEGLYLFPRTSSFTALRTARPIMNYTTRDGLATLEVFCIYEDSHGDLWVSTVGSNGNGLARWERTSRTLHDMAKTDGLPSLKEKLPTAFSEDRAGNLWVGFNQGELARYRNGRFTLFTTADGLPASRVDDLYLDRAGRLWIAVRRGLVRVDDPTAEHPNFITYTTAQGLSSNYVTAITEDLSGRIYIGTGQGLDRLDMATGRIRHYTTADGLALGEVVTAACDREGSIWIGTPTGLSRMQPEATRPAEAPPILIKRLSIAGASQHVSAIGQTEVSLPDLSSSQNQLQIDFVGLSFAPGESLRYQYRLEGGAGDWTTPSTDRSINFANLAPGRYRFFVRAVNSDGVASAQPATISFVILRPIWQRWWFLTLVALGLVLVAYTLYRYRMSRFLELEQVRTRIASDLHDDIGSGLSRLAILSEVARHEAGATTVSARLGEIAQGSRQLVDSMSDIVWVINPRRDQLRDLVQRMRRFASDLFTAGGIEFTFRAPDELDIKVGADVRRQLFMIFKEAANNVARHSACTKVEIQLMIQDGLFIFTINDNGRGFDPAKTSEGNGLVNMRERARMLKGELVIDSHSGAGTTITLKAPLKANVQKRNGRLRGFPSA